MTIEMQIVDSKKAEEYKKAKQALVATVATINGALYFFVAAAGVGNLKVLFNLSDEDDAMKALYAVGSGASLCYGAFVYKTLENLTLLPTSPLSIALASLAPFGASTFLTAGIEGSDLLGLPLAPAIGIGMALFMLRSMSMVDGAVKFPSKYHEMIDAWSHAFHRKDYKEIARLILTLYTAVGFSLSATDAIYAAINKIALWVSRDPNLAILSASGYVSAAFGAVGLFPLSFYWTHRGMKQLTFAGKIEDNGSNKDPSDIHTVIAGFGTLPVMLGILGSVTSAGGSVFGRLGVTSSVIRVSSSILYAVCGGVPGLSTISRQLTSTVSSLWAPCINRGPQNSINASTDETRLLINRP